MNDWKWLLGTPNYPSPGIVLRILKGGKALSPEDLSRSLCVRVCVTEPTLPLLSLLGRFCRVPESGDGSQITESSSLPEYVVFLGWKKKGGRGKSDLAKSHFVLLN